MNDELIVVDRLGKAIDGAVVQSRVNGWDGVFLRFLGDGEAIRSIDTQVDDRVDVERRLVSRSTRTEEVINARVGRDDLVVIGGRWGQARQGDSIGVSTGGRVCRGT